MIRCISLENFYYFIDLLGPGINVHGVKVTEIISPRLFIIHSNVSDIMWQYNDAANNFCRIIESSL